MPEWWHCTCKKWVARSVCNSASPTPRATATACNPQTNADTTSWMTSHYRPNLNAAVACEELLQKLLDTISKYKGMRPYNRTVGYVDTDDSDAEKYTVGR